MTSCSPDPSDETASRSMSEILRDAIDAFTTEKSPRDPVEINGGYCRAFATFVVENYPVPDSVEIIDAWDVHTWLKHDGMHYDAEIPGGTTDPHEFPVWNRPMPERREIAVESCEYLSPDAFETT